MFRTSSGILARVVTDTPPESDPRTGCHPASALKLSLLIPIHFGKTHLRHSWLKADIAYPPCQIRHGVVQRVHKFL